MQFYSERMKFGTPLAVLLVRVLAATLVLSVLLITPAPLPVQADGALTITSITGANVILDSNAPASGPQVFVAEAKVCNTGTVPLTDVKVYIGDGSTAGTFPDSSPMGYSLLLLDTQKRLPVVDVSDATRSLGDLNIGQCVFVYWPIYFHYPTPPPFGTQMSFTIWGTTYEEVTGEVSDTVTVREDLSASANKLISTTPGSTLSPADPYAIGQQVDLCYTSPDFGVIGAGEAGANDLWFQPSGDTGWDPDVLRLVGTTADLMSNKCLGATYHYDDITYLTMIDNGDWDGDGTAEACSGTSQQISGRYCYKFVALAEGTSTLKSYQEASSGNLEKRNGDYGVTVTIPPVEGCSISLSKSTDKDVVSIGDPLIYTIDYTNLKASALGYSPGGTLIIEDTVPVGSGPDVAYQQGTASCPSGVSCIVYYSTDNGATWSSEVPETPSAVNKLRFVIDGEVPANESGSASYSVTVLQGWDGTIEGTLATSNFGGGATCAEDTSVSTTPVTLAYFQAQPNGDAVRFEWSTSTEAGNLGFNLYVDTPSGRQQINDQLIPSQKGPSPVTPRDYIYDAAGVQGSSYYIEDVDSHGKARLHGPFDGGKSHGERPTVRKVDSSAIQAEHKAKAAARADRIPAEVRTNTTAQGAGQAVAPAATLAVNGPASLSVDRTGIYRVTYEDLLAAGFDFSSARPGDLALTNRGQPVPMRVQSGSKFTAGSFIEFYGQALGTLYTHANMYKLEVNPSLARRIVADSTAPSTRNPLAPYYLETAKVQNNRVYDTSAPNGDPWLDTWLEVYGGTNQYSFSIPLDNYDPAGAAHSSVSVDVWGWTSYATAPDHRIVVKFNDVQVADEVFDGVVEHSVTAPLPTGVLEGANRLTLQLDSAGHPADIMALDRYAVTYPRAFVARDGTLTFEATGGRFKVDSLPSAAVVVYRLGSQGLVRLTNVQVASAGSAYSATFAGTIEPATYFVYAQPALLKPGLAAERAVIDITNGTVDYVMIAHPDFISGLTPLVEARQAQGMTVRVVDVEDVYAQFNYGIFDPAAIRDYIAHATNSMGAKYFLLVGGDTTDYHNYSGGDGISFMPSFYAKVRHDTFFAPADPMYTDLDNDGVPERPIGRLPVRTSAELDALVAKTLAYGAKTYGGTAVFAADRRDGNISFRQDSEAMRQLLPGWNSVAAYIDDVGVAAARTTLVSAINQGVAFTNYAGHSSPSVWTWDPLFSRTAAAALTNAGRPTVVAQYGCWNTYYVNDYETVASTLLLSGSQGAAAAMGPSSLAEPGRGAALGALFTANLAQPGMTIGAAAQAAKEQLAGTEHGQADVMLSWSILGDPTLVVQR